MLVVSASVSVNMVSLTLQQVIAKMQRSHVQLLSLLRDDLRVPGSPLAALRK